MAHDIIDSVGKLNAERASHGASLAPGDVLLQDLTPSSLTPSSPTRSRTEHGQKSFHGLLERLGNWVCKLEAGSIKRRFGVLFQKGALWCSMTPAENV